MKRPVELNVEVSRSSNARLYIQKSRILRGSRFSNAGRVDTNHASTFAQRKPLKFAIGARGAHEPHRSEVGDSRQLRQTSNCYVRASGGSPPPVFRSVLRSCSWLGLIETKVRFPHVSLATDRHRPRHRSFVVAALIRVSCHERPRGCWMRVKGNACGTFTSIGGPKISRAVPLARIPSPFGTCIDLRQRFRSKFCSYIVFFFFGYVDRR